MEASIGSVKALAAARSAEGSSWKQEGYRSPAEHLAHQTGTSTSSARRALEAGRRMAEQPEVAGAALAGDLSPDQASAVSDGVAADPSKARELIEKARQMSMPELNEEVARTKAAVTDAEARRQQRHAQRSFKRFTDRDGALQGRLYGHPEDGATIWRMLDPIRRRLNADRKQAAGTGPAEVEPLAALDYDSLKLLADLAVGNSAELSPSDILELGLFPDFAAAQPPAQPATAPPAGDPPSTAPPVPGPPRDVPVPADPVAEADLFSSVESNPPPAPGGAPPPPPVRRKKLAGSPVKIIIRIDLDAFLRGVPLEGELCEVAGFGQISVSTVRNLVASGQSLIAFALTRSQQVVSVYHHGRRPNAHQRTALDFSQPGCSVLGCSATTGLQYDHRIDYSKSKITAYDLIDRLCRHHHAKKTREGWGLVEGMGKRAFVPPDDPRHPRHAKPPSTTERNRDDHLHRTG